MAASGRIAHGRQKWLPIFLKFIEDLRIDSKEVQAQDTRGVRLRLWGSQKVALEGLAAGLDQGIRDHRILKGRQLGETTLFAAIDLFWMAAHHAMLGCMVSDTDENRKKFRRMIQRYMNSFPSDYFGEEFKKVEDNATFMSWSNGSRLDFLVAGRGKNPAWGEGKGYAFVHASEVASYGDPSGVRSFREALAEHHENRLFVWESTAKGYNLWYSMLVEADENPLTMKRHFIGWWTKELNRIKRSDPRFSVWGTSPPSGVESELINAVRDQFGFDVNMEQLAWYRERWHQAETTGTMLDLQQNQPWIPSEAFITTGRSFFQVRRAQGRIGQILENRIPFTGYRYFVGTDFFSTVLESITTQDRLQDVELRVWEEPTPRGLYAIGCDPAYGRSEDSDRTCIEVFRCYADKIVQVAEFVSPMVETHQCAWILAHIAGAYKNCQVNIELGGPGRAVLQEFDNLRGRLRAEMYAERIKDRGWEDVLAMARDYMYHKPDSPGAGFVRHFETNWRTKRELMNQYRDSFSTEMMIINSIPLLEEMTNLVQENDDIAPAATGTSHDDRVFAAALANRCWVNWLQQELIAQGASYERMHAEETGEISRGADFVGRVIISFFKTQQERADDIAAGVQSSWLEERGLE